MNIGFDVTFCLQNTSLLYKHEVVYIYPSLSLRYVTGHLDGRFKLLDNNISFGSEAL